MLPLSSPGTAGVYILLCAYRPLVNCYLTNSQKLCVCVIYIYCMYCMSYIYIYCMYIRHVTCKCFLPLCRCLYIFCVNSCGYKTFSFNESSVCLLGFLFCFGVKLMTPLPNHHHAGFPNTIFLVPLSGLCWLRCPLISRVETSTGFPIQ